MAAKRTIKRRAQSDDLAEQVTYYLQNRSLQERASREEGKTKAQLMEILSESGELQEGGHRVIHLDNPLPFTSYKKAEPEEKKISGIQRKRRVTTSLNEERVMKLLARLKLTEECTTTVTVVDEDAVLAANYNGKISDVQLAGCYDESENFAFYLVEGE